MYWCPGPGRDGMFRGFRDYCRAKHQTLTTATRAEACAHRVWTELERSPITWECMCHLQPQEGSKCVEQDTPDYSHSPSEPKQHT